MHVLCIYVSFTNQVSLIFVLGICGACIACNSAIISFLLRQCFLAAKCAAASIILQLPQFSHYRYKVTCESTWPMHSGSAKKATELIARRHKVFEDVAFGNTKVFIRTPRTLTLLEQERAARIPQVVLIMQRV